MNESQARRLEDAYRAMGYLTTCEQTGGSIWVVNVFHDTDLPQQSVTIGIDSFTGYDQYGQETRSISL